MNGKHFFFIRHNDLGIFCSVTLTTVSTYISVLENIWEYCFHTLNRIHSNRYILFFPQKQCTQCISQPTQSCIYNNIRSTYKLSQTCVFSLVITPSHQWNDTSFPLKCHMKQPSNHSCISCQSALTDRQALCRHQINSSRKCHYLYIFRL